MWKVMAFLFVSVRFQAVRSLFLINKTSIVVCRLTQGENIRYIWQCASIGLVNQLKSIVQYRKE